MRSNSISKFSEEIDNNYNYNYNFNKPIMGLVDVKSVDSTANVINKVEPNNIELEYVNIMLLIIVIIMCANCFYKLYKLHNKCLRKKYMSRANDLDKI